MSRPPSSVYVLNFPDVQTVAGTVSVDNLPAVQTVGGTVNVGNLPLDVDGAVRVTSAPVREPVLLELAPGGIIVAGQTSYLSQVVDVTGYSKVGLYSIGNSAYAPVPIWRWAGAPLDEFDTVVNSGEAYNANASCQGPRSGQRLICAVSGVQLRFRLFNGSSVPVSVDSLQVYLIP